MKSTIVTIYSTAVSRKHWVSSVSRMFFNHERVHRGPIVRDQIRGQRLEIGTECMRSETRYFLGKNILVGVARRTFPLGLDIHRHVNHTSRTGDDIWRGLTIDNEVL